jgi:hypothetical protein
MKNTGLTKQNTINKVVKDNIDYLLSLFIERFSAEVYIDLTAENSFAKKLVLLVKKASKKELEAILRSINEIFSSSLNLDVKKAIISKFLEISPKFKLPVLTILIKYVQGPGWLGILTTALEELICERKISSEMNLLLKERGTKCSVETLFCIKPSNLETLLYKKFKIHQKNSEWDDSYDIGKMFANLLFLKKEQHFIQYAGEILNLATNKHFPYYYTTAVKYNCKKILEFLRKTLRLLRVQNPTSAVKAATRISKEFILYDNLDELKHILELDLSKNISIIDLLEASVALPGTKITSFLLKNLSPGTYSLQIALDRAAYYSRYKNTALLLKFMTKERISYNPAYTIRATFVKMLKSNKTAPYVAMVNVLRRLGVSDDQLVEGILPGSSKNAEQIVFLEECGVDIFKYKDKLIKIYYWKLPTDLQIRLLS